MALVNPARCWPITAAGPTHLLLALPQVDQECRDQNNNKWVAAPGATANMPISVTTHRKYYPD
jgi:hypothetical protein